MEVIDLPLADIDESFTSEEGEAVSPLEDVEATEASFSEAQDEIELELPEIEDAPASFEVAADAREPKRSIVSQSW